MARTYTENRKKNNLKWDTENLDRISVALPKGMKDQIKATAAESGKSMNEWIKDVITEKLGSKED